MPSLVVTSHHPQVLEMGAGAKAHHANRHHCDFWGFRPQKLRSTLLATAMGCTPMMMVSAASTRW